MALELVQASFGMRVSWFLQTTRDEASVSMGATSGFALRPMQTLCVFPDV